MTARSITRMTEDGRVLSHATCISSSKLVSTRLPARDPEQPFTHPRGSWLLPTPTSHQHVRCKVSADFVGRWQLKRYGS